MENPLDLINPELKKPKDRYLVTYVKVKWLVDGEVRKSWESRTTIRRLWNNKKATADKAIYFSAKYQEERYD